MICWDSVEKSNDRLQLVVVRHLSRTRTSCWKNLRRKISHETRLLNTSQANSKRICKHDTSSSWSIELSRRESWRVENKNTAERAYNSVLHIYVIETTLRIWFMRLYLELLLSALLMLLTRDIILARNNQTQTILVTSAINFETHVALRHFIQMRLDDSCLISNVYWSYTFIEVY